MHSLLQVTTEQHCNDVTFISDLQVKFTIKRSWKFAFLMHSREANISCQNSIKICIIFHFTFVSITQVYHFNSRLTRFREINLIGHAANSIITPRSLLLHVGMINLIWGFNLETKLLNFVEFEVREDKNQFPKSFSEVFRPTWTAGTEQTSRIYCREITFGRRWPASTQDDHWPGR